MAAIKIKISLKRMILRMNKRINSVILYLYVSVKILD